MMVESELFCGFVSLAAAMLASGVAEAQDTAAPPPPPATTTGGVSEAQDTAAPPATGGDIVVTAQRRSERLTDVPASITALPEKLLANAGVTASTDLAKITPGLTIQFYGGFLQPAIRGVTSGGANVGEASNVATYIDGVYQPQQIATLLELPDIERIEVLKGPQGALYGQDATGGAILVNSFVPSFQNSGKLSASYGNYNDVNLRGYVTGPIFDKLAFSISGGYHDHEGYRRNVATDQRDFGLNSKSIRGKLLFQPSSDIHITLTGYYADRKDSATYAGFALNGNSVGYGLIPTAPKVISPSQFGADPGVFTRIRSYGADLLTEINTGAGTFTNITSYLHNKANYVSDPDYSPVLYAQAYTNDLNGHYFQSDTNFASRKFGPVNFLAGVFYLNGAETFNINGFRLFAPSLPPAPAVEVFNLPTYQRVDKQIIAGYGEATVEPVDHFFITGGGRYTVEKLKAFSDFAGPTVLAYPGNPLTFEEFTPRVNARYALNGSSSVYISWSKGFKSGGINLSDYTLAPFKPEKLTSYEAGFKGRLTSTLRFNASAFYYDYKNLQIVQYNPPEYFEENAAKARIKGFDFDTTWNVTPQLVLSGGGTYLDAHYLAPSLATVFQANATNTGDDVFQNYNIAGKQLLRAPKFTGNIGATYTVDTNAGEFGAYVAGYYNSGYPFEVSGQIRQARYATLDGNLSFSPAALHELRFTVYAKNLTNKAYLASLLQTGFGDGAAYAEPRTFGIRGEFNY